MTLALSVITDKFSILAVDSKATVDYKTYNGSNKIFKLDDSLPIGVMIYGLLTIGGVPVESLIEHYKRETDFTKTNTVKEVSETFFKFLKKESVKFQENDMDYITSNITNFEEDINNLLKGVSPENRLEVLEAYLETKPSKLPNYFKENSLFDNVPDELFDNLIEDFFKNSDSKIEVIDILKKNYIASIFGTGIIFSGFDYDTYYASYSSHVVHGFYNGKLVCNDLDSQRYECSSIFESFAQTDTVNTILTGINEKQLTKIYKEFYSLFKEYSEVLIDILLEKNDVSKENMDIFINVCEEIAESFSNVFLNKILDSMFTSSENIKQYFNNMSSDDIIETLIVFIKITEILLKLSDNLDTIGGEIKIGLMSKQYGFKMISFNNENIININNKLNPYINSK